MEGGRSFEDGNGDVGEGHAGLEDDLGGVVTDPLAGADESEERGFPDPGHGGGGFGHRIAVFLVLCLCVCE